MENEVIEKLKTIYDPEIPVDIYNLGLIYKIEVIRNIVFITMTLTTATCPAAGYLPEEVMNTVKELPWVKDVHVHVTYEPHWTQAMMSEEARFNLGFD